MLYKCFVFAGQLVQSSFTSIKHKKTHNKRTNTPVVIKVICNEKHHTKYKIGHLTNIRTDHGYYIKNSLITFRSSGYYFFMNLSVTDILFVRLIEWWSKNRRSAGQGKTVIFRLIALQLGVEGGERWSLKFSVITHIRGSSLAVYVKPTWPTRRWFIWMKSHGS